MSDSSAQLVEKLKRHWGIILVICLAFGLRFALLLQYSKSPFHKYLTMDERFDDQWALSIALGDPSPYKNTAYYRDPGYAYCLGAVYTIAGHRRWIIRLLQLASGLCSVFLFYRIGERVFDKRAGLFASVLCAAYAMYVLYTDCLSKESLSCLLTLIMLAVSLKLVSGAALRWWLIAGLVFGAGAVLRGTGILFAAVLIPAAFVMARSKWSAALERACLMLLGMGLIVAPVTIRNFVAEGDFVPITWQTGPNFYFGNGPFANGTQAVMPGVKIDPFCEHVDLRRMAEPALRQRLNERPRSSDVSDFWRREALKHMLSEPGGALLLLCRKLLLFWNAYETPDPIDLHTAQRFACTLRLAVFRYGLVAALALLGIPLALRRRPGGILLLCLLGVHAAATVAFYVTGRYRLPSVPFLILLAGAGGAACINALRERNAKRLLHLTAALTVCLVLTHLPIARVDRGVGHLILGSILEEQGKCEAALAEYVRVRTLHPESPQGYLFCARALEKLHRTKEAVESLRAGVAACPNSYQLQLALGAVLLETGHPVEAIAPLELAAQIAPADAVSRLRLARAHEVQGNLDQALACYRQAVTVAPRSARAHALLARCLLSAGLRADARAEAERALRLDPSDPVASGVARELGLTGENQ